MKIRRLMAVARKEFIHVIRDWRSLALAIAIPIFLIALFGYALTMDLKHVPTAVWDQSRSAESQRLLSLLDGSAYFSIERQADNYRDLSAMLDAGRVMVALVIPANFADRSRAGRKVVIQAIVDGSDANNATLAIGYINAIGQIYNHGLAVKGTVAPGAAGRVVLAPRAWYNPDMDSRKVVIPGIIALVMVVIAAMLTSVTVAREWETGTMEQLISTPIRALGAGSGKGGALLCNRAGRRGHCRGHGPVDVRCALAGQHRAAFFNRIDIPYRRPVSGTAAEHRAHNPGAGQPDRPFFGLPAHPAAFRVCLRHLQHAGSYPGDHLYRAGPLFSSPCFGGFFSKASALKYWVSTPCCSPFMPQSW